MEFIELLKILTNVSTLDLDFKTTISLYILIYLAIMLGLIALFFILKNLLEK